MNNNPFGNVPPQNMPNPNQNVLLPPGIRRCGADQIKIKPRPIQLKIVNPKVNNQPQIPQQPNLNMNIPNNNNIPNNINNNANPNPNNHPNIPHQWRDFY